MVGRPPSPDKNHTVTELASILVAGDEELRDRLRALVSKLLDNMEYTMKHGAPSDKLQLTKAIIPGLLRGLGNAEGGEGERKRKAAYERMMDGVRGNGKVAGGG